METRRWWWQAARFVVAVVAVTGVHGTPMAHAGTPVAGVDVGAAFPTGTTKRTVDPGGMIAPWLGYRLGDTFAVTAELQPQFVAFPTSQTPRETNVTGLFVLTSGLRFSMIDEDKEVFFKIHGGLYSDVTGQLDQTKGGFAIAAGFNYDLMPGTALGLFLRRDESSIQGAINTKSNFTYASVGLSLTHRFLPPSPPPPAPVIAEAAPAPPPPAPMKRKIVLRGVNFDFDKSNIRADAAPVLDEAVSTLQEASSITIAVAGHTDGMGTEEYNQGLSERRANAVRDYLASHGINKSRMTAEGFGKSRPVATNDTAEGRAQNRRVELRITSE